MRWLVFVAAMFGSLWAQPAAAQTELACWAFEFVPGERQVQPGSGPVQRGRVWLSGAFTVPNVPDLDKLAEFYERHVRATQAPFGAASVYVSGCTGATQSGPPRYSAGIAHSKGGSLSEDDKRRFDAIWAPNAADLAAAARPEKPEARFGQCFAAVSAGSEDYFVRQHRIYRSPVFRLPANYASMAEDQYLKAVTAKYGSPRRQRCYEASSVSRLKRWEIDEIDHSAPGSPVFDMPFEPEFPTATPSSPSSNVQINSPALTISASTVTPSGWTPAERAQARKANAERAKAVAEAKRNEAATKAQLAKFFEELRKRGRAQ